MCWGSAVRSIEAHHGTSIGGYFSLLRALCVLNALLAAVVGVFLVLPWLVEPHRLVGAVCCDCTTTARRHSNSHMSLYWCDGDSGSRITIGSVW
jgi:hypothetical protein